MGRRRSGSGDILERCLGLYEHPNIFVGSISRFQPFQGLGDLGDLKTQTRSHEALANVSATQGLGGMAHVPWKLSIAARHGVENFRIP